MGLIKICYTLNENKPYDFKVVLIKTILEKKHNKVDYTKIKSNTLEEEIRLFSKKLIESFDEKDLTNFYNNINSLEIILDQKYEGNANAYVANINKIFLEKKLAKETVFHELFHLASSVCKDNVTYCGFTQWSNGVRLGIGLTEGYTELLRERYFGHDNCGQAYEYDELFAELTEAIIGKEKMTKLYLNANLKGLIEELNKYSTKEEIMNFIAKTDFINTHKFKKPNYLEDRIATKMLIESYKSVKRYLLKTYLKKFLEEIKENKEDQLKSLEITTQFCNYLDNLTSNNIVVDKKTGKEVELLPPQEINKELAKATGNKKIKFYNV